MTDVTADAQPWYRSLNRSQWNTLIAANLGWLFDGYETYALIISVAVALRQLLDPSQYSQSCRSNCSASPSQRSTEDLSA